MGPVWNKVRQNATSGAWLKPVVPDRNHVVSVQPARRMRATAAATENRLPKCCKTSGFRAGPERREQPYFFYASRIGFVIRCPLASTLRRLFLGSSAVEHPTVNRMV